VRLLRFLLLSLLVGTLAYGEARPAEEQPSPWHRAVQVGSAIGGGIWNTLEITEHFHHLKSEPFHFGSAYHAYELFGHGSNLFSYGQVAGTDTINYVCWLVVFNAIAAAVRFHEVRKTIASGEGGLGRIFVMVLGSVDFLGHTHDLLQAAVKLWKAKA